MTTYFSRVQGGNKVFRRVYIGYNKGLDIRDVPKQFKIFFTPKDEWQNIIVERWFGHQNLFVTNTPIDSFPLQMDIYPLSRDYYYPLPSNNRFPNSNMNSNFENCFTSQNIVSILNSLNCTEICIPINLSSLFNTSDIQICTSFDNHFCAFWELESFVEKQLEFCNKTSPEKYFKGLETPRAGFYNHAPDIMDKDRLNRTLILLYWRYKSNLTAVYEEKLVYGSKVI